VSADDRWFSWNNTAVTDRRYKVKRVLQKSHFIVGILALAKSSICQPSILGFQPQEIPRGELR
jgi:hypothetical protein